MHDDLTMAAAEMAKAVDARSRVIRTTRVHGAVQFVVGVALMVVAALRTWNGVVELHWALLSVVCLSLAAATFRRARQLEDARKQRLSAPAFADAVRPQQDQQD